MADLRPDGAVLPPHVVLVGLPGAGKTVVGRVLARQLGRPFVDFDEEIVRRTGMSVADLFSAHGEAAFRAREAALTREFAATGGAVLAPGGGWVVQQQLVALLRPPAVLVHLEVSPDTAASRLRQDPIARPLLAGPDPAALLAGLWEQRNRHYREADLSVSTEVTDVQGVADAIAELIARSA